MELAQLSPNAVLGNPAQINPLAQGSQAAAAAYAGSVAQQKTVQSKSDSVTLSRQALEKAAKADSDEETTYDALKRGGPQKATPR